MASNMYAGTEDGKIIKFSGFTNTVTSSLAIASTAIHWDGTNVWWALNANPILFKQGSGFSTTVTSSFAYSDTAATCYDMHYDAVNSLLIWADGTTKIRRQTGFSATVNSSITTVLTGCRGVTWDGTNLYASDGGTAERINKYSGFSTTVLSSLVFGALTSYKGLTWDGTNIYWVNNNTNLRVVKAVGFSTTVGSSFSVTGRLIDGLDWGTDAGGGAVPNYNFFAFM